MKKILLSAAVIALCAGGAFAQQQTTQQTEATQIQQTKNHSRVQNRQQMRKMDPQKVAEMKTSRLDKMVNLTDDQKAKVQEIYLKDAQTAQEKGALRKQTQDNIKSVLTADQTAKLEAAQKDRKAKMGDRKSFRKSTPANKE